MQTCKRNKLDLIGFDYAYQKTKMCHRGFVAIDRTNVQGGCK